MTQITIADFTGGGDGVTAVYIDGKLWNYGDEYHNDVTRFMDGFLTALTSAAVSVVSHSGIEVQKVLVLDESLIEGVSELADSPPETLENLLEFEHKIIPYSHRGF